MENPEKAEGGLPLIGEKAPDFEAVTTQGPLRLSDFEGSWLVMFSPVGRAVVECTLIGLSFRR